MPVTFTAEEMVAALGQVFADRAEWEKLLSDAGHERLLRIAAITRIEALEGSTEDPDGDSGKEDKPPTRAEKRRKAKGKAKAEKESPNGTGDPSELPDMKPVETPTG